MKKLIGVLDGYGFKWITPFMKIASGEDPKEQIRQIASTVGIPLISFLIFLGAWSAIASKIDTSLGKLPGPVAVFVQSKALVAEYFEERRKQKEFYNKQVEKNSQILAEDPNAQVKIRKYTGKPTYLDQICTSLLTVFTGFFIASLIALPVGVICGLSRTAMTALNPFIQIFKPISPLAWLPLVTMVVSAVYTKPNDMFPKAFIISAITVSLCSLWPTLINTALGVASLDKDYINVSRVLQLGHMTKIFKVVIPASLPYIFTGLRISLGVGWMVLIASEMLAQNPGLGKFVWDEFQNGSSESLAKILVAVFTIGIIGFILDRIMVTLQKAVSFNQDSISA
jgi:nitrate/nitrite transport system permease protein